MQSCYKKVEAAHFTLTDNQKAIIRSGESLQFEGEPVRWNGGEIFMLVIKKGEGHVRVLENQWLVKHPEGTWQVLWPDEFKGTFTFQPSL